MTALRSANYVLYSSPSMTSSSGWSITSDNSSLIGSDEIWHDHSYNSGTVTQKADCTTDGVRTYTCSQCGATKTEAISATGHTPSAAVTETGNDGKVYSVVYCSTCGDELGRTVIADELVNNSTVNKTTVTAGTNVTITSSVEGGTAPYYYAYYYKRSTNTAWKTLGTEFGTNSSVAFAPTAEAYFDIKVIVKDADGNTAEKLFSVQAVAELPLTNVSVVGRTSVNLGTAIPHDRKGSRRNFSIYLFLLLQEKHKYKLEALG